MGGEESGTIGEGVRLLQQAGLGRVSGPWSADTLFYRAAQGEFDGVVCMYHDQGLIPLKLHAFHEGVNVTLGLPFPRTSPDHGTAFDIAGTGQADPSSLCAALQTARKMAAKMGSRPGG